MNGTPYIERPEEHAPTGSELFCFLDSSRPCTAECAAYLTVKPEGTDYENQQFSACMVLVSLHKIGKHHVALAQQGASMLKHLHVKTSDERRANQSLPHPVK